MDSHDPGVGFDSVGSQQTRLSGFFRNVHSKFSRFLPDSKKDPKGDDVVIISQVERKKPLLVIGNYAPSKDAPPEAECGNQSDHLNGLPTPPVPALVWSNVNEIDSKKGIGIVQVVQTERQDSIISEPILENTVADYSNGDAVKQPNAGAGTKRKATELEDMMNKRIDAQISELLFPTSYSNAFQNTKPAIRKEPESRSSLRGSDEETVKAKVSVKKVTWGQDSDWIHEPSVAPKFAVPDSLTEISNIEPAKDIIVQQNRNRVQAPPSGTSILPNDCNFQDGPLCLVKGIREDSAGKKISKEGSFNDPSTEFSNRADGNDSEKCTSRRVRHRGDVFLGDSWSLPVDLKGDVFSSKLKEVLCKPFDSKESSEMWELAARRKPILKLRQTRTRTVHVPLKDEGLSYLDHHPDLAQRIKESSHPAEKLALLRAFFFWLQHSCMEGSYKPWALETKNCSQESDCILTDGPDCPCCGASLDEKNEVSTVSKPLEPVTIDLSDDDEDDCTEVSLKLPEKAVPKTSFCENFQKNATCICCFKEFGVKDQQRALYRTCGHIETCMKCVDRLWKIGKHGCLRCGVIQLMQPISLAEFADSIG